MARKPAYKSMEEYLSLPYTIEVVAEHAGDRQGWFAKVVEFPGCMTQAERFEDLRSLIQDAMRAWIEASMEAGWPIPEPRSLEKYSGRFVTRVSRSLHRELAETAAREGVSMNAFVNMALAKAVRRDAQHESARAKG